MHAFIEHVYVYMQRQAAPLNLLGRVCGNYILTCVYIQLGKVRVVVFPNATSKLERRARKRTVFKESITRHYSA